MHEFSFQEHVFPGREKESVRMGKRLNVEIVNSQTFLVPMCFRRAPMATKSVDGPDLSLTYVHMLEPLGSVDH